MADQIFDAGRMQALRTRSFVNGDGVLVSERRPNGRIMMMIDSAGNEIPLRLTNAISVTTERDPYGQEKIAQKCAPNALWKTDPMIPSGICPQQTEFEFRLPQHLKTGRRCTHAVDGHSVGEDKNGDRHWCKCITDLVKERRDRQNAIERTRDPMTTIQQAILNNSQDTTAKLTDLLGKLMEAPTPQIKGGK